MTAAAAACSAAEKPNPVAVVQTATLTHIEDNTGSSFYSVVSARLERNGLGTTLVLGFDITNANAIKFNPVSTVTFADGTVLKCEEKDPRRTPSLVETTTSWDFPCEVQGALPDSAGAVVAIVDTYH